MDNFNTKLPAFIEVIDKEVKKYDEMSIFKLCCYIVDICLKDYTYVETANNRYWDLWINDENYERVDTNDIRRGISNELCKELYNLINNYESIIRQYNNEKQPGCTVSNNYYNTIRLIEIKKKLENICKQIDDGSLFKEFINCYNNKYFS